MTLLYLFFLSVLVQLTTINSIAESAGYCGIRKTIPRSPCGRANEGFTHLHKMHLLTISCFKLHLHMYLLTKEVTKDIAVSFRLHIVTVNCHSSSCSHLFPVGKREEEEKGRVDALSFDNCT